MTIAPEAGNVVRLNTTRCEDKCPKCDTRTSHHNWNNRIGQIEFNASEMDIKGIELECGHCKYTWSLEQMIQTTDHRYYVHISGQNDSHDFYSEKEFEAIWDDGQQMAENALDRTPSHE